MKDKWISVGVFFENETNVVVVVVVVVLASKIRWKMKPLVSRNDLPGRCGGRCCTKRRGEEKYIDSLKAEAECQYLVVVVVEVEVDLCGNRVNVAERFRFTKKLR